MTWQSFLPGMARALIYVLLAVGLIVPTLQPVTTAAVRFARPPAAL